MKTKQAFNAIEYLDSLGTKVVNVASVEYFGASNSRKKVKAVAKAKPFNAIEYLDSLGTKVVNVASVEYK